MRPISDSDSDVRDHARDPDDDRVPAQREPDHDGQLYAGAAHPDTDLTPDEAAHHEPVAVDDTGERFDRDPDDHEASAVRTADDDAFRDETARDEDDEPAAHGETDDRTNWDETDDETPDEETARDETPDEEPAAVDEVTHDEDDDGTTDEPTARDDAAPLDVDEDEPTPVEAAHGTPDDGERDEPVEPPAVMVTPLGPAQVVAVPGKMEDRAEPAADLDHDDAAAEQPAAAAADPAAEQPASELKPGDVPVAPAVAFLADDAAQDLRQRWRDAQLGFVDDPRQAAQDVRNLVNEAIDKVVVALQDQRDDLNSATESEDTEQYRVTVQRCRAFFDRLLSL